MIFLLNTKKRVIAALDNSDPDHTYCSDGRCLVIFPSSNSETPKDVTSLPKTTLIPITFIAPGHRLEIFPSTNVKHQKM